MEISLHSNQKHIAVGYYLKIIRELIKSPRNPFKILYYADLFCGDGSCEVKRTHETYEPPIIDSILKEANESFKVCCFLNDLKNENIEQMKKTTAKYKNQIGGYYSEDANTAYKKILPSIPLDQFTIFFLDPYNHNHLKWDTIKEISEHSHTYYSKKDRCYKIRRPELIINCMTYTMIGSYMAKDYQSINENLGTDEWQQLIRTYKEEGKPVPKAFLDTFIKQLEGLGYKVPQPIEVKETKSSNNIYYLVWATNENGYDIIEKRVIPYLKKTVTKTLLKNKRTLKKVEAKEKGDLDLNNWINQ